ncbi:brachyurin [Anoplophora glabripennis]|nr:brachyurin [Anoplophora glabripennis]
MKFTLCFLAIIYSAVALPAHVTFETPDELDLSKLVPNNIHVEPINSSHLDLPGSRIIGGAEVARNSIPYQVAVIINGNSLCGGSLISASCVLTAAHCTISASFVQVRLGAHYFNIEEETQVRVTSTSIKNHIYYSDVTFANDISVILLPEEVNTNDNIQVIPLAPTTAGTFEGSNGLLTGWGRTTDASNAASPTLRGVYVDVIGNNLCRTLFGSLITAFHLCTSGTGIVGGCTGDSGGPLVIDGVQVGLLSLSASTCEAGHPTVFSRISNFRTWITENSGV